MRPSFFNKALLGVLAIAAAFGVAGCSTDENPITPQKMQEIRKKEQDQRRNFNPNMSTPPAGAPKSGG